jgi:hypothetical protein
MKRCLFTAAMAVMIVAAIAFATQPDNGDVNCDEDVNILDIVHLINYKYKSGPEPCPFISPGVAFTHWSSRTIDVSGSWQNLAFFRLYAPDAGWVKVEFSHYVATEAYCMQYQIASGVPDKTQERAESYITSYTADQPISWSQIFYVLPGTNEFHLNVRYCLRDQERANVTFDNINFQGTYFPEYYGDIRED